MATSQPCVEFPKSPQTGEFIAGMITKHKKFWFSLNLSSVVRQWVSEGFKVNFLHGAPSQSHIPRNHATALKEKEFARPRCKI